MEKFTIIAESTTYYTIELEAENAKEAWDLAEELGKDSFTLDKSYESTWYLCGMYSMDGEEWYDDEDLGLAGPDGVRYDLDDLPGHKG